MPKLFVVATPIGNLGDVSARCLDTLRNVAFIAAEDTRVTGNLLRHFGIRKRLVSCHRHNEENKAPAIVARMLAEDADAALVTDAGTPAISDPGHLLVREAVNAGIEVLAVAGPSAMAAALSVSGFDAREFAFYGFLPRARGDLRKKLLKISRGTPVAVAHESPHRIIALMEIIAEALPECRACVCCDLTKRYEKTLRGAPRDVLEALRANPKADKGEYCVVLDFSDCKTTPPEASAAPAVSAEAVILDALLGGASISEAVEIAVTRGIRKNDAKRASLRVKQWLDV